MRKSTKTIILSLVLLAALAFPLVEKDSYYQHLIITTFLSAISVYALNIITGFTGQLNIAHAGFMGIGAYVSAILTARFGFSFWVTMPSVAVITGLFGLLIGYPSLRVRGIYFSLTTLGFGSILYIIFDNWVAVTGGPMGITGIPAPSAIQLSEDFTLTFSTKTGFYYLVLVWVLFSIYLNRELFNSRLGRAMLAVRENEDLAQSVGISVARTKVLAFVMSTALCGISGCLFAHYFRVISPVSFSLGEVFRVLTMLVVGGMGTLSGPFLGTLIFTILPEVLRSMEDYEMIAYGFILMLCAAFFPEGITGYIKRKSSERAIRSVSGEKK